MLRTLITLLCLISFPAFAADKADAADKATDTAPAAAAPVAAAETPPAPIPAPTDSGKSTSFFGKLKSAASSSAPTPPAPPAGGPLMKPVEPYAEIKQDDGKWIILPAPFPNATSQQCSAIYQLTTTQMMNAQMPMSYSFIRTHNNFGPEGKATDMLQINMMSMSLPKGATQGVLIDKDDAPTSNVTGNSSRNAVVMINDIPAFEKKVRSGSKVSFKLDDQSKELSAKVMGEVIEKMNGCIEQAAADAKKAQK